MGSPRPIRRAFTLVELLIVIAIIGVLTAILLPAVQAARESARRATCTSHLRQVTIGLDLFHDAHAKFPHGGWGRAWVGVPERGTGTNQPGGWLFQILPYIEEEALFALGRYAAGATQTEAYSQRLQTPIPILHCPSRRAAVALPPGESHAHQKAPRPAGAPIVVARGDYAINGGASHVFPFLGPTTFAQGDDLLYWRASTDNRSFTGVSHLRRSVARKRILDGAGSTLLVAEKFLAPRHYASSESSGDNDTIYSGYDLDNHRFVANGASPLVVLIPQADNDETIQSETFFGSAHAASFGAAFADGSVRSVEYGVDREVWWRMGHRGDGDVVQP